MKKLLYLLLIVSTQVFGQTPISQLPIYLGNPSPGWVPVVIGGTTRKVDASYFGYNKIDSGSISNDTLYLYKHGVRSIAIKLMAGGSGTDTTHIPGVALGKSISGLMVTDFVDTLIIHTSAWNKKVTDSLAAAKQNVLGFTPYNATNPSGFINSAGAPVQSVAGRTGVIVLLESDIANLISDLAGKQATLVNQTNIKSINNLSLVGPGNLTIAGGGGTDTSHVAGFGLGKSIVGPIVTDFVDTLKIATKANTQKIADSLGSIKANIATTLAGYGITDGITASSTNTLTNKSINGSSNTLTNISADVVIDGTTNKAYTATEKTKLGAITGTNTGDETGPGIRTKLGITTLSGSNTGDQDLSGLKLKSDSTNPSGYVSHYQWDTAKANLRLGTRWIARVGTTASSTTPTINTDNTDIYKLTAQTADITSFTTNLTGTPNDGDVLEIQITGTAARGITWGASFVSSTIALPVTTVTTTTLTVVLHYYTTSSFGNNKWVCVNTF